MTGPHMSEGPKGQRVWDFSKDLPTRDVLGKSADVIPFPKQKSRTMTPMKGAMSHEGIKGLMQKGDVRLGQAPKTTPEHLKAKKDRGILLRDADEDILRIKRENNDLYNKIADLTEVAKSKDYFRDPDYKFLIEENRRLEEERNELLVDNKKLSAQIEDRINQMRKSGM